MSEFLHHLRGMTIAEIWYGSVFVPLLIGLIQGRATWRQLLLSPITAAVLLLVTALAVTLARPVLNWLGIPQEGVLAFVFNIGLLALVGYLAGEFFTAGGSSPHPLHLRGAVVSTVQKAFAHLTRRNTTNATDITLAGIPVSPDDETKHFKLIGTTGTGKSTAIQEILTAALARGDRAVIADADGGYLRRFYDPGRDVILNPFDGEARKWDLFGEIANDYDVEQLARSLIPDSGGPDRSWTEYARTFFAALMQQAISADTRDDVELYRLLTSAPVAELRDLLTGTAAGPFVAEGNERMFFSLRSVAISAVRVLRYTTRQQGEPLSVRQWVSQGGSRHTGGRGGILFFPYKAGEIAALGSVISTWMRLSIFEAMDREEGDQRLWFVIDELDALGEIDGLKDALARLRKFGGRCIVGFQSIAQVSGTYGKGAAETIVENCGNTLILRCSASERGGTSEFASKLIGQRDVIHTTKSETRRSSDGEVSTTSNQQLRTEPAVMASEIERLPNLAGYLKLASIPDWVTVKLTPSAQNVRPRPRQPATVVVPSSPVSPAAAIEQPTSPISESAAASASGTTARPRKPRAVPSKTKRTGTRKRAAANAGPMSPGKQSEPLPVHDSLAAAQIPNAVQNPSGSAQLPD